MDLREVTEFFRDAFKYIIVVVVILLLLVFVLGFQQVMGPSMEPTFKQGDIVLSKASSDTRFFAIKSIADRNSIPNSLSKSAQLLFHL